MEFRSEYALVEVARPLILGHSQTMPLLTCRKVDRNVRILIYSTDCDTVFKNRFANNL